MNGDLILIIPILLIIVAIMFLVRHMRGRSDDSIAALIGIVPIVIVIGVAIGIIVSMASIADPWEWDADSKTLTIDGNIHDTGLSYPWTGYADRVESLVIEPGVEFVQGPAFARMTNLEYVDIAESVTLDDGAFAQTFKDPFDADIAIADVAGYEYIAYEGVMYQCDPEIFTYTGDAITGLASSASGAKVLVLPSNHGSTEVTSTATNAFKNNTAITKVFALPKSTITIIGTSTFQGCTALSVVHFPDGLKTIKGSAFGTAGITEAVFPDTLETIEGYAFQGCSSLSVISFPASIETVATGGFGTTNGVTSITFAEGFDPTTMNYGPWNFYASDGETQLERTAANLAGKTFQGISTALVEVINGAKSLTPDQLQKVHLHDAELERIKLEGISIDPLPFELQDA